jgi:hypothetical protein
MEGDAGGVTVLLLDAFQICCLCCKSVEFIDVVMHRRRLHTFQESDVFIKVTVQGKGVAWCGV